MDSIEKEIEQERDFDHKMEKLMDHIPDSKEGEKNPIEEEGSKGKF